MGFSEKGTGGRGWLEERLGGKSWDCWAWTDAKSFEDWPSLLRRPGDLSWDLLRLKMDVLGAFESEVLEGLLGIQDEVRILGGEASWVGEVIRWRKVASWT